MIKIATPGRETQMRFGRFVGVGGLAYVVQVSTMALLLRWLAADWAFTCSFCCSTTTHYALNRFWALPSFRRDSLRQLGEYLGTAALSYVINLSLFKLSTAGFGLGNLISTAIAVPPSTLVVFLILNYRVFRHRRKEAPPAGPI